MTTAPAPFSPQTLNFVRDLVDGLARGAYGLTPRPVPQARTARGYLAALDHLEATGWLAGEASGHIRSRAEAAGFARGYAERVLAAWELGGGKAPMLPACEHLRWVADDSFATCWRYLDRGWRVAVAPGERDWVIPYDKPMTIKRRGLRVAHGPVPAGRVEGLALFAQRYYRPA
jgi:hypothetical protein